MADDEECFEDSCKRAFDMSGKQGVHIVTTGSQIPARCFDEDCDESLYSLVLECERSF